MITFNPFTGNFDIKSSKLFDVDTATPLNLVTRIHHGFQNYLSNAGFEIWNAGTSVAPTAWTLAGDATVARSSTATIDNYSAQITFGVANTGELYQAIPVSNSVDYTFSCYVQRTSGTGAARLVAQDANSPYTEYSSVTLNTSAGWQLACLTVKPTNSGSMRFSIKSGDTVASTWLVDECQFEESKGVATTFNYAAINDTSTQNIYGNKNFGYISAYSQDISTTLGVTGTITAGALTVDTSTLKVDSTNHRVGFLTTAPTHTVTLSSTATGIALYNTTDQTTNYERIRSYTSSNTFKLSVETGGTGTVRDFTIDNGSGNSFTLGAGQPSNGIVSIARGAISSGTSGIFGLSAGLSATSGTQFGTKISITSTQSGTAGYTAILANITETSTGSGTKNFLDFQIGGTSRTRIDNLGNHVISSAATSGLRFFNTADEVTNTEVATLNFSSNVFNIVTTNTGTGTIRAVNISSGSGSSIALDTAAAGAATTTAKLRLVASSTGSAYATSLTTAHTGSSGTQFGLYHAMSVSQSGTAGYTSILVNVTETSTGSGTKSLMDLRVGGTSMARFSNTGSLIFASGASINGATGVITLPANANFTFDATTGSKIGTSTTEKLAFWNTTPIVQPTTAVAAATFVANTSAIANDTATFDGYTIGQVVKALRNIGLLA